MRLIRTGLERVKCISCDGTFAKVCLHKGFCAECSENHYGLNAYEYQRQMAAQDKKCAICKSETYLVSDHDHKSGFLRGLICRACNGGLGAFQDSFEMIENAVAYLLRAKEREFNTALDKFGSSKGS